jgi:uncharacterized protein (UPF0303 family)
MLEKFNLIWNNLRFKSLKVCCHSIMAIIRKVQRESSLSIVLQIKVWSFYLVYTKDYGKI